MLIDITPLYAPENHHNLSTEQLATLLQFTPEHRSKLIPVRLRPGVWEGGLSPTYLIAEKVDEFVMSFGNLLHPRGDTREPLVVLRDTGLLSSYGVCDGIDNLLDHPDYAEVLRGPRRFTVFITEIRRDTQPSRGGWRWHKWGPYIGAYERDNEYLYDEDIDSVWIFSIVEHVDDTVAAC